MYNEKQSQLMSVKKLIIWDVDGTLLNTSAGIIHSVRYTEKKLHLPPLNEEDVRVFLGPPPKAMYMKMYGLDEVMASEAVRFHREYSRNKAIFEAEVYDGIPEALNHFQRMGVYQAIATLKGQIIAETLMDRLRLSGYFDMIAAMDPEETKTKSGLIREVIEHIEVQKSDAVLIGDSKYDAIGAEKAGIDFIGVTYGFGFHSDRDVNEFHHIGVIHSVEEFREIDIG